MCIRDSVYVAKVGLQASFGGYELYNRANVRLGYDYFAFYPCLLYTSDAADERSSVDLGGRRIIKKKKPENSRRNWHIAKIVTTR